MRKYIIDAHYLFILLSLQGCSKQTSLVKKKVSIPYPTPAKHLNATSKENPPPITLWIHGTRLLRRPIFRDFFDGRSAIKLAYYLDKSYYLRIIADTLSANSPTKFPLDTFYIFGWSGKLNTQEREDTAYILYKDLLKIVDDYQKKYTVYPVIRIITHSHGGNIALNMPLMADSEDPALHITELILLACPVQIKTMHAIHDPMFKQVYSLYSSLDMIQILAPQFTPKERVRKKNKRGKNRNPYSSLPSLSSRRFPLQQDLKQAKIKINGRSILHSEFNREQFITHFPQILTIIDEWYSQDKKENTPSILHEKLLSIYTQPKPRIKHKKRKIV